MSFNANVDLKKNVISGEVSKKILSAIQYNQDIEDALLHTLGITQSDLISLKAQYVKKLTAYKDEKLFPRNLIFYQIIQDKIPSFSWNIRDQHVDITRPKLNKKHVSLLSLLTQNLTLDEPPSLKTRYPSLNTLSPQQYEIVSSLLEAMQIIYPDRIVMDQIVLWLKHGLAGKPLHIFSLACPDYSVEPTGNSFRSFRHTFSKVGAGIGLVAKRILDAMPIIQKAFDQLGIQFTPILAMADYEVLSATNLKNLGVTEKEFLLRLDSSRAAFKRYCKVNIETPNMLDLCGSREYWQNWCIHFQECFRHRDFGRVKLSEKTLLEMVKARKALYTNWFGRKDNDSEYLDILLNQAAEYAVVGKVIAEKFQNCLVLGADHSVFGAFYNVVSPLPVLYLKRFYL
jgi:hypothetical protein